MAAPRLRLQLAVAGLAVTAVLVADSSGLLSPKLAMILDDSAQLGGGVFAAVCCLYGARNQRNDSPLKYPHNTVSRAPRRDG